MPEASLLLELKQAVIIVYHEHGETATTISRLTDQQMTTVRRFFAVATTTESREKAYPESEID